jgi:glycine betaine/proline transport system ATP-binding protein
VVDPNRRLIGAALDDDVIAAVRSGSGKLDDILHYDDLTVSPDTPLVDLLIPAAESRLPLAVVEDGRLVGVIPRVTLLAALGGSHRDAMEDQNAAVATATPSTGVE